MGTIIISCPSFHFHIGSESRFVKGKLEIADVNCRFDGINPFFFKNPGKCLYSNIMPSIFEIVSFMKLKDINARIIKILETHDIEA